MYPSQVQIREVGPRDGLQSISTVMPTAAKVEWIRLAHAAGVRKFEVGSFVPPKLLPQMADTAEVVSQVKDLPGIDITVLVPNLKGAQRAIASGAHNMVLPISASVAHSRANVRKEPEEMIDELRAICAERDASGVKMTVEAGIGTAFGCGIQGYVDPQDVLRLLRLALDAGADKVGLADTIGYADPAAVRRLFPKALAIAGDRFGSGHFHDTRGLGLANVVAAMECGVTVFDASLAGIGGCPFAPGASGNVCTEDLVYMLQSMGVATGISLEKLLDLHAYLGRQLPGETLRGLIAKVGLPKTFDPATHAA